jgi:hypothetical protein
MSSLEPKFKQDVKTRSKHSGEDAIYGMGGLIRTLHICIYVHININTIVLCVCVCVCVCKRDGVCMCVCVCVC